MTTPTRGDAPRAATPTVTVDTARAHEGDDPVSTDIGYTAPYTDDDRYALAY
ncbi:hypothetical protein [Nocardia noduli]|uniref:hypothetical protein n=1 Tax=Nocardia noduli TaxID=2815722 RepID=UPI001C245307|nr:hypothetical protein [Nocardia noduli]